MEWIVPDIWQGGDCWIFGGGSSILDQFQVPDEIRQQVFIGEYPPEILTPYFEVIKDKHIIAINEAFKYLPFADMVFFGDKKFYTWNAKALRRFPKPVVTCCEHFVSDKRIRYIAKDQRKPRGISMRKGHLSWNANSGSAAISIAAQAGAKRIFLLGFDMMRTKGHKHFHKGYVKVDKPTNPKRKTPTDNFDRHLLGFPKISHDANLMGVKIYNVNPESQIKEFEKITLEKALCQ